MFGAIALVATLPTTYRAAQPAAVPDRATTRPRTLRAAAGRLDGGGTIFIDTAGRPFPDPYNDTIAAELVHRGVPVRVAGDYISGQYGKFRRLDDDEAVTRVRVLIGHAALVAPVGRQRLLLTFVGPQPMALVVAPTPVGLTAQSRRIQRVNR